MKFNYYLEDDIMFITFDGDLIGEENGPEIIEAAGNVLQSKVNKCAVDITNVRYINSSGIGVLITLLTKFRNADGEVILINPSEHVKKLLVITKLSAIFNMATSKEEAKNELKK